MARRTMRRLVVPALAGALVLASVSARAAEGMPQLDFANPLTLSQVVWLAVIFAALYLVLSQWALPRVASVLEMRAATIATDLDAARAAKAQADAAVAELTRATREAHTSAQTEIAQAAAAAKQAADQQQAELTARLDKQIVEAEQRIADARSAAMGALGEVARDTAREVVGRLAGGAVPQQTVDAAVAAALTARTA